MSDVAVFGLRGLPELQGGDDLAALLLEASDRCAGGHDEGRNSVGPPCDNST